jgi:cobalt-zinc-cadmium efflux system membrane fusion protein
LVYRLRAALTSTGGSIVRSALSALLTVAVLASFVGIWYWGHKTHWTIPSFSSMAGGPVAGHNPEAAPVNSAENLEVPTDPTKLAPVRFANEDEVRESGLAIALARRGEVEESVTTSAEIGYNQYRVAQLASRVPGHVYALRARLGRAVKAGEVLALIDAEAVGRAKAEYIQEVFLTRYKAEVLDRYRSNGAVPARTVLDAEAAVKEAELRRFTARQRLINLGLHPPDPDKDEPTNPKEFARKLQFLGLPPDVVAELDPRPETANLVPLTAPFDGVVTRQDIVAGEVVSPEKPAFVVADLSSVWINLAVRKEDAGRVRTGQAVRFAAAGLPGPITGKLDWIGPEADEKTRTLRARCEVLNPVADGAGPGGRLLRVHLFGSATIVSATRQAVVVPDAAVQRLADGSPVVFVRGPDGKTFRPQRVKLGVSRGGVTEIVEGVAAGSPVVTDGSYVLKSELMKDALAAN